MRDARCAASAGEDGGGGVGGGGGELEDAEVAGVEVDAVGEGSAGVDGYAQGAMLNSTQA